MKSNFTDQYYFNNTIWKRNLNSNKIKKFNICYSDQIIFHFDIIYSIYKVVGTSGIDVKENRNLIVDVLNVCLRNYAAIKSIYPYNLCNVLLYTKNNVIGNLSINYNTMKPIIDIIPNFAIITDSDKNDLYYFNDKRYKHIFYGNLFSKKYFDKSECQFWNIVQGNIIIT